MRRACLFIFLVNASCSTGKVQEQIKFLAPVTTTPPAEFVLVSAKALTSEGESSEAYFSPDGGRILYRSEKRAQHQHPQIYEMDLSLQKERRVTYHDGEDSCAFYHPKTDRFFYASTTDEIKEERQLDKKTSPVPSPANEMLVDLSRDLPPFEIYESGLDGTGIERITNSDGYDSEVSLHPTGQMILFSSARSGDVELYTMDIRSKGVRRLTNDPGMDGGAFFSPRAKQIVWRHINPELTTSQILLSNHTGGEVKVLTTKKAIHWAPFWHPNGQEIIFSSNRDESENFELYTVDTRGLCLKRLTYASGTDTNPSFSPDGSKIVFTSNRTGQNQIYMMDYQQPSSCASELP